MGRVTFHREILDPVAVDVVGFSDEVHLRKRSWRSLRLLARLSAPFRQVLSGCGLSCAVGIPGQQKVYPADVVMIFSVAGQGQPRHYHILDSKSVAVETLLTARFLALRVRGAYGPTQRIRDMGRQHLNLPRLNGKACAQRDAVRSSYAGLM